MRITIKQYAVFKWVTSQAITHRLRKNSDNGLALNNGLPEITRVTKLGRSYELEFNGYWDTSSKKSPKLKSYSAEILNFI